MCLQAEVPTRTMCASLLTFNSAVLCSQASGEGGGDRWGVVQHPAAAALLTRSWRDQRHPGAPVSHLCGAPPPRLEGEDPMARHCVSWTAIMQEQRCAAMAKVNSPDRRMLERLLLEAEMCR